MATYELWTVSSGNVIGTFPDEAAALEAVAEAVERNGATYGDTLALGRESSRGDSKIIASGSQLTERAVQRGHAAPTATRRRRSPGG